MRWRLSFRQKVWVSVGVAVVGMAGITVAASVGLTAVGARVRQVGGATEALRAVADAEIAALRIASEVTHMTSDKIEAFRSNVAEVRDGVRADLDSVAQGAAGPLASALSGLSQAVGRLAGDLSGWADGMEQLGFGPEEGTRKEFAAVEEELAEKVRWFSYLREALVPCREDAKNLFLHRDPGLIQKFGEDLDVLVSKLRDQKMEDYKGNASETLGETVERYREAFTRMADEAVAVWRAEEAIGRSLEEVKGRARDAKEAVASLVTTARAEAEASARRTRMSTAGGSVVVGAVLLGVLLWLGTATTRALNRTVDILKDMAQGEGDLTRRLPYRVPVCSEVWNCGAEDCPSYGVDDPCWSHSGTMQPLEENVRCREVLDGKVSDCRECPVYAKARSYEVDEFDRMAHWFNLFLDKVRVVVEGVKTASQRVAQVSEGTSGAVGQIADAVGRSARETGAMAGGTGELADSLEEVDGRVNSANSTLADVADATRQMADTIGEIAKSTETARQTTTGAVTQARQATERVANLTKAADRIASVTQTINEISEQTRLLALNATIEAARAGESGKGFAVVANEIKELARQTAEATEQIRERIEAIVGSTQATSADIESVAQGIAQVEEVVAGIAAAVEEQSVTTKHIADGVGEAAGELDASARQVTGVTDRSRQVSRDLSGVAEAVERASREADGVREQMEQLVETARSLSRLVARFQV
ncbi:methyl-accepting chemotaxis protein [Deferrisoma camini]|uniref:methyl-accepting chemotaxis protein n=1 Tax=Deferrisoma camini TaxID=1035120 RepID=UPI00046D01F7|nr:methyl-accepting chemotaxis protein [Deferrisoma camini]